LYSENGVLVDFEEITRLISEADVFTVAFGNFPERLIVDTRSNDRESPMVQVVEPANGARERVRWLTRRRPSLGSPQAFSFFAWPHSPSFLTESGIWDRIRRRVGAERDLGVDVQCEKALTELQNLDSEMALAILKGERCITLWPRDRDEDAEA
jgi:hypothetical protein